MQHAGDVHGQDGMAVKIVWWQIQWGSIAPLLSRIHLSLIRAFEMDF